MYFSNFFTDSSIEDFDVFITRLGNSGGSYGEDMPVKFSISPFFALA